MAWLFTNGKVTSNTKLQWAPLLTSHDPNPPIALEGVPSLQIAPSGIASAEAFGTIAITITISPTGIVSAESFGTPSVGFVVAPTSIASQEAFGTPTIIPDQSLTPTGIASEEAFGNLSIYSIVSVFPTGIASEEGFGNLQITLAQLIIPIGIGSEESFGAFSVLLYPPPPPSYALSVRCEYRSCGDVDDFSEYSLQDGSERTANSSSLCVTRTCSVLPDIDIYNIQTGNIAPESNVALSCATRTCADSGVPDVEIYNLQDALFFNGTPLSFLIQCPNGQVCPPGVFPRLFTYPPGTFYFPQPPPGPCSTNIVLEMRGCESTVTRVLPCGSSPALINAAAQQIIEEVAEQQANCDAEILFTRTLGIVLSDLPTWACIDSDFDQIVTGFVPASVFVPNPSLWVINQFDFIGNSQPLWMSAAQTPGGSLIISGSPTSFGPVSFTVQAVAPPPSAGDPYAVGQKTYTIEIIGISTASPLPNAVPEEEFSQTFAATGFGSTPLWGLAYGSLPDWMAFNTNTGTIYGTPPIEDDGDTYTFAIFVQDGERQCVKEFELSVGLGEISAYWSFDKPGEPTILSPTNFQYTDDKSGLVLTSIFWPSTGLVGPVPGYIANGFRSHDGITSSLMISSDPVTPILGWEDLAGSGITIWAWIKFEVVNSSEDGLLIVLSEDQLSEIGFRLNKNVDTITFQATFNAVGSSVSVPFISLPIETQFIFLCGTYDKDTELTRLYVNGNAPIVSFSTVSFPAYVNGGAQMGSISNNATHVDEFGVNMKKRFTDAQVLELYNSGAGLTWPAVSEV
jgi:hypothetical protein